MGVACRALSSQAAHRVDGRSQLGNVRRFNGRRAGRILVIAGDGRVSGEIQPRSEHDIAVIRSRIANRRPDLIYCIQLARWLDISSSIDFRTRLSCHGGGY